MKKFRTVILILLLALFVTPTISAPAAALEDPTTAANAVMLIEASTGEELYSKNADALVYPASTTKIMTALLACEAVNAGSVSLSDQVTATSNMTYDLIEDGSSANIVVGETMSLENLLYCAMLSSGNDACNVIAEYISGSISQFVDQMNARALELGCTGTHFANAHGIPNDNHYTTARDMALIAAAAASNSLFMEICNSPSHTVPATNMSEERELENSNALINENSVYGDSYYYENAAGIKTGHTSAAGYCLVSYASNGTMDIIAVVMGSTAVDQGDGTLQINSFTDSITLYDWAFENFSYRDILRETELIAEVPISMGSGTDTVSVRPQDSISLLLPNDANIDAYQREIVIYSERDGEELMAPLDADVVLGEITVTHNGEVIGTSLLVSTTGVELSKIEYMKQQISEALHNSKLLRVVWILVALLCLYLAWVIAYRVRHLMHLNSVRKAKKARAYAIAQREAGRIGTRQPAAGSPPEPDFDFYSEEPDSFEDEPETEPEQPYYDPEYIEEVQDPVDPADPDKPIDPDDPGDTDAPTDYYEKFFK